MSKEILIKQVRYQTDLKSRLDSKDVPAKHKNREASYREFLSKELKAVTAKVEALKMNEPSKK